MSPDDRRSGLQATSPQGLLQRVHPKGSTAMPGRAPPTAMEPGRPQRHQHAFFIWMHVVVRYGTNREVVSVDPEMKSAFPPYSMLHTPAGLEVCNEKATMLEAHKFARLQCNCGTTPAA